MNGGVLVTGKLVGAGGILIGTVRVSGNEELWSGEIDMFGVSPSIVSLFARYEALVNGQVLSCLDAVEAEISELGPQLFLEGGAPALRVFDLQIYPSQCEVSFRSS